MKPSYWLFGSKQIILSNAENTDGHYDLIEGLFPPGAQSPLHVHANYTETIIVLEGTASIFTPGQHYELSVGQSHFIPKNVPHAIANGSSTAPFRALAIASPSGFATLIEKVGIADNVENESSQQQHDMELVNQVLIEIGDAILGPPGARP